MKITKILVIAFLIASFLTSKAEEYPWEKYGFKFKVLTLSNGKYQEFHDLEDVVEIGSILYNTQTNQVVGFVQKDSLAMNVGMTPHLVSRWMCADPLSEEYSSWSPYNYTMNNPIKFIDPNGMYVDNYGIDENGYISLLEKTDDKYDVLYAVNNEGNKKDTDGQEGITESDGQKVEDKTILPELSKVENVSKKKQYSETTTAASGTDALAVFKFAADNSNVEWGLTKFTNNGNTQYSISTYHNEDFAPGLGQLGINENSVMSRWHTHPDILPQHERSSMGEGLDASTGTSDLQKAINRYYRDGKEAYSMNVYFPITGNFYHVSPYGVKYSGSSKK